MSHSASRRATASRSDARALRREAAGGENGADCEECHREQVDFIDLLSRITMEVARAWVADTPRRGGTSRWHDESAVVADVHAS